MDLLSLVVGVRGVRHDDVRSWEGGEGRGRIRGVLRD